MCGIFCSISNEKINEALILKSLQAMEARGPDNQNFKVFGHEDKHITFGHTRLSIIDLSDNANQPFENDNFVISFNGEIYNHLELRKTFCKDYNFLTHSDTETLIGLFSLHDPDKFMPYIRGMFAFTILNKKSNILRVYRDRAGEKPVYISTSNKFLAVASDLSALRHLDGFNSNISMKGLGEYLKYGNVPYPYSIYEDTFKLQPGGVIEIDLNIFSIQSINSFENFKSIKGVSLQDWWSYQKKSKIYANDDFNIRNNVHDSLSNAVKSQLISDVPVGVFLSGGIDSSLIAAFARNHSPNIESYNIGFEFSKYDESFHAKRIADYLDIKFNSVTCTKENAIEEIYKIPNAYSEPFGDSSQIPTMLVSKFARSCGKKVVITGDCGDELFGGYNRYLIAKKYASKIFLLSKLNKKLPIKKFFSIFNNSFTSFFIMKFMPHLNISKLDRSINKIFDMNSQENFYMHMVSEWMTESDLYEGIINSDIRINDYFDKEFTFEENLMHADFKTYMTDDILTKVDRASMAYGLETRAPFLDCDVIDIALSIPLDYKISKQNISKFILKDLLSDFLPNHLFSRPKQGFGVPINNWLREDLKEYATDLLSADLNNKHNFFNQKVINEHLHSHISGDANFEHRLWYLIQFNAWYEKYH